MPYGIMDKSTADILKDAGIDPEAIQASVPEDGTAYSIDIIFDGALDESFLIGPKENYRSVVDVIADRLISDFPDNNVSVSSVHVYVGEGLIEGSGYDHYERHSER